jgi:hypothetical protein
MAPARAQSLHGRFLGGEACGATLFAIGLRLAIADFPCRIDALQKAVAKARDRLPGARNLRNIDTRADDYFLSQPIY